MSARALGLRPDRARANRPRAPSAPRRRRAARDESSRVTMALVADTRVLGIGLTLFGALFLLLGCALLFDKGLLVMGNVLFLAGTVLLIGAQRTVYFFFRRPDKLRGTICFLGGIVVVLLGYPVTGMLVELFGIVNLFGNFFPYVVAFLRQFPVLGTLLRAPIVDRVVDRLAGGDLLPTTRE